MDGNPRSVPWREHAARHAVPVAIFSGITIVVGIIAATSYEHEYLLALLNGQSGWVSRVLPASVDGMIFVAAVAIMWGVAHKARQLWRPGIVLGVGALATVAANLFSGLHYAALQRAVSGWPGVAIAAVADVGMWFVLELRRQSAGPEEEKPPGHSCPPPPLTLAEALSLARAELRARGEEYGEDRLAERFGVTRHAVRKSLSPPVATVAVSVNGSGPNV